MITCRELVNMLLDAAGEGLAEDQRERIREHLSDCSGCRQIVAAYQVVAISLSEWISLSQWVAENGVPAIDKDGWGAMNRRRGELIHKKNREGLTEAEREEFERLQRLSSAALESAFPRPPLDAESLARLEATLRATSESRE